MVNNPTGVSASCSVHHSCDHEHKPEQSVYYLFCTRSWIYMETILVPALKEIKAHTQNNFATIAMNIN